MNISKNKVLFVLLFFSLMQDARSMESGRDENLYYVGRGGHASLMRPSHLGFSPAAHASPSSSSPYVESDATKTVVKTMRDFDSNFESQIFETLRYLQTIKDKEEYKTKSLTVLKEIKNLEAKLKRTFLELKDSFKKRFIELSDEEVARKIQEELDISSSGESDREAQDRRTQEAESLALAQKLEEENRAINEQEEADKALAERLARGEE